MTTAGDIGSFTAWDYVVFALMLLISAIIGIYYAFAGGGQKTSKDFLMGGRSMTGVPVALSLTASFMSAVTVLGTPAEIYRFGAMFSIFAIVYTLVVVITSEVYLPVFYRLGITSTYEYLELRFNRCVRLIGTLLFIIQTVLYTGIVIYAPALALNQVTGFDLWRAVVVTGVVCTFYFTLGGLKAVVWTDVFQVGIMVAGFSSIIIQAVVVQGFLYGAVCIAMAGLASVLGGLLQAALSIFGMVGGPLLGLFTLGILFPFANSLGAVFGLLAGFAVSLWVGIGSLIYPTLPIRSLPKYLSVECCNFSTADTNWTLTTAPPTVTDLMIEAQVADRPALADDWYSLSYLYFSTIGTILAVIVGIIVSLLSGGLKQNVNRDFLLTSQDFAYLKVLLPSSWGKENEKVEVLNWKNRDSDPCPDKGTDNPAFSHMEMYSTEKNEKLNGINP